MQVSQSRILHCRMTAFLQGAGVASENHLSHIPSWAIQPTQGSVVKVSKSQPYSVLRIVSIQIGYAFLISPLLGLELQGMYSILCNIIFISMCIGKWDLCWNLQSLYIRRRWKNKMGYHNLAMWIYILVQYFELIGCIINKLNSVSIFVLAEWFLEFAIGGSACNKRY